MRIASKHPLLLGAAWLLGTTVLLYGCKNFLSDAAAPEGTLSASTLQNKAGVEGTLVAAYRALDCTSAVSANWGCAASNWVWGSIAAGDAYKGSDATDQPPINDIEGHHWGSPDAQTYLNEKWRITYEGVVRANATLRLLADVQKAHPGEISRRTQTGSPAKRSFSARTTTSRRGGCGATSHTTAKTMWIFESPI